MSFSYKNLVNRANRGSVDANKELVKRSSCYVSTGLFGINGEKIVIRESDEIIENCNYILNEIKCIKTDDTVSESILIDSLSSATIEGARTTVDNVKKVFNNPISKSDKMVVNAVKAQNQAYNNGINNNNIRNIWEQLVEGVVDNKSADGTKYRSNYVYVGSDTKIVHTPENPKKI